MRLLLTKNCAIVLLVVLMACDSEYRGRYLPHECKLRNGNSCDLGGSYLQLDFDKTFLLKTETRTLTGKWNFFDDGDAAVLRLTMGRQKEDCMVGVLKDGRKVIDIGNPHLVFDNDSIESVMFVIASKE